MKERLLKQLSKAQLRHIVGKIITINQSKLEKMNRDTCIKHLEDLKYRQMVKLSE
jgi:hypothetical protein